jgi:hypothetical protein
MVDAHGFLIDSGRHLYFQWFFRDITQSVNDMLEEEEKYDATVIIDGYATNYFRFF